MLKKLSAMSVASIVVVFMAVGVGMAAVGSSAGSTITAQAPPSTITVTPSTVPSSSTVVYDIGEAGSVTVSSTESGLSIVAADAAQGWTATIERRTGTEVEAAFRNQARTVEFNAELEQGQVQVRVREQATVGDSTTTSTTMPQVASATSTYQVGPGGTVTVESNGAIMRIQTAIPAPGWSASIDRSEGHEVEMTFSNGIQHIEFRAELDHDQIKVSMQDRVQTTMDQDRDATHVQDQDATMDQNRVQDQDATHDQDRDATHVQDQDATMDQDRVQDQDATHDQDQDATMDQDRDHVQDQDATMDQDRDQDATHDQDQNDWDEDHGGDRGGHDGRDN